jgi:long-chain acyl-CoA synthetase
MLFTAGGDMYAGKYAVERANVPAFIMAGSGEAVSYAEFDARTNRLAHLLRAQGLKRLDHYAIYMENNSRYLEACGAGERAGLYYTCVNSYLTVDELAYILQNSQAKVLVTSAEKFAIASQALMVCPNIRLCLVVGGGAASGIVADYEKSVAGFPAAPIADEWLGTPMLYSSGTTGRPKGILRPLPENPPSKPLPIFEFLSKLWRYREKMIYL